ncbi:MAG: PD-(D/E)XK nuclease family protein [Spirochaetales bacterium]
MQFNLLISNTYLSAFESVLNKLKTLRLNNSATEHILIVPDRMTLLAEKSIFEKLGVTSLFNVRVLTLSKLASLILGTKLQTSNLLTKQSGIMLTSKIIMENSNNLKAFKKASKLIGFSETIFDTINQLKSCNVTPEEFKNSYAGGDLALKLKIEDIALLYSKYETYLEDKFIDASTKLNLLSDNIGSSELIANSDIYFALFDTFTPQQYKIISLLVKHANSINVGFVSNTKQNNQNIYPKDMYENLTAIASSFGLNINSCITNNFDNLKGDFNHILHNLYALKGDVKALTNGNIRLIETDSIYDEVDFVASQIKNRVVTYGYRYSDINLAVGGLENYSLIIEKVFNKYEIPYYLDKSKPLIENIYSRFLLNVLDIIKNYFSSENVIEYVKSIFTNTKVKTQENFENIVLKYGLSGGDFLKPLDFINGDNNLKDYEDVRKAIIPTLLNLQKSFNGAKIGADFVVNLKEFIASLNIKEKLEKLELEYENMGQFVEQKITAQVYEKVDKLLNEIDGILGETNLTILEFKTILENGLQSVTVSTIPLSVDSVFVGDASVNNFVKTKDLFVLGCVDGTLPMSKLDVGILLDDDLQQIAPKQKIEPSIRQINFMSKFNFFELLLTAQNRLTLTYSVANSSGEEQKPSQIFNELKKIFDTIVGGKKVDLQIIHYDEILSDNSEKVTELASEYSYYYANKVVALEKLIKQMRLYRDGNLPHNLVAVSTVYEMLEKEFGKEKFKDIINLFDYDNNIPNLKNADKLFFNNERTKISQLEAYFSCPFKHFIEYGLKLKEREIAGITSLDVGTILHSVAEKFGASLKARTVYTKKELEKVAIEIIEQILNAPEYEYLQKSGVNKNLIASIKEEAVRLTFALYYQTQNSDFNVEKLEYRFGLGTDGSPLTLKLKNRELNFGGVIDRVDIFNNYFRIIDYKTGSNTEFTFKDLYYGKKIQLFIYASVIEKLTGKKPAGVFYFPIKNSFEDDENVGKEGNSMYKLDGTFLNDLYVIKAFDKTLSLSNPKSKIINVTFRTAKDVLKTGAEELHNNSIKRSVTDIQFKQLMEYAIKLSEIAVEEILDGNITPSPYVDKENSTICDYCAFKGICKFSEDFNNFKRTHKGSLTKEQIVGEVK